MAQWLMPQKPERPLRLLATVPNKVYSRLIVRYPGQSNRDFALSYRFSAKRLGETFTGRPVDDLILLPFLTLYRQAFELELKNLIQFLVKIRVSYIEGPTSELMAALSDDRLRDLGHNLHRLLNEAKKNFAALDLDESFPKEVEDLVTMLHEADKAGTAFRYAGQLPESQDYADFPDLAAMLDERYDLLTSITDFVDYIFSASPTLRDLRGDDR